MQHSNCTSKSATTGHQRLATWRRLIGLHNGVPEHGIVGGTVDVSGERWREKISYETRREPDVSVTSWGGWRRWQWKGCCAALSTGERPPDGRHCEAAEDDEGEDGSPGADGGEQPQIAGRIHW